jgi:predicted Zn-dependent protease
MKSSSILNPVKTLAVCMIATVSFFYTTGNHAELPTLGDPTLGSFSNRDEARLGQAFYHSLRANLSFVDDLQLAYYLQSLGERLVTHSDAAADTFKFFIIESSVINAFAGPDAHIGIHSGLLLESKNESQLASVIAHEISHVSQRHLARAIDKSGNSAVATFATVLAAILLGSQDSQAGQAVLMGGIAGAQQAQLNFTRSNEYEADRIGIGILADAGINPEGMVEFFETLLAQSGGGGIEYLRTHPLNTNRVSEAKNRLKESQLDLPRDSDDFQFAHARLSVLTHRHPEVIAEDKNSKSDTISIYKKAIALIRINKPEQAIPLLKPLTDESKHPWIKLALAEAYRADNQQKPALKLYQQLSNFYPGYLPLTLAYAKALTANKQPQKSIALLKHQLQLNDGAVIHKTLAHAYFINGQISAALESTGNQYAKQGYIELALQQYDSALQQPDISVTTRQRLETKKKELKTRIQSE